MTVLTIATADVRRLCGIDSGDTSQDSAIAALISAEQLVHEYALDPGILGLAVAAGAGDGCLATLTLGVAEIMAGDYLQLTARAGTISGFQVSGLKIAIPPLQTPGALGSALTKAGLARLAPFTRAARSVTASAAGTTPDGTAAIPLLIASSVLSGSSSAPPGSVFDAPFGDVEDADDPAFAETDGDFGLLWGQPEP